MQALVLRLSRTASKFLNLLCELCWLVPVHVASDERIVRAIYSPYHVKKNRLKHQAYDPTPRTDEISVMRLEHMGARFCKRKAKSLENPATQKVYRGFAVLSTGVVRTADMEVIDSRKQNFCGHADIQLLIDELKALEPNEPPTPETQKKLKDLKESLLDASKYIPDSTPQDAAWRGDKLEPPL